MGQAIRSWGELEMFQLLVGRLLYLEDGEGIIELVSKNDKKEVSKDEISIYWNCSM